MIATSSRRRAGFTLIELLVVIGIIVLLIAIAFPMVGKAIASGKRARTQADMGVIQTALEEYKKDHAGQYPLVDGTNTGFAVLARELVGVYGDGLLPGPAPQAVDPNDPPAAVPGKTYLPGECVGGPGGPFLVAMVENSQPPAAGAYWAQFASPNGPRDGADGPGISVNGRKAGYIPADRLKVRGCAILDQQDKPILYFRAHGNPNVNKPINGGPSLIAQAIAGTKFDANDGIQFFARVADTTPPTTLNTNPAMKRIRAMLGDFDAAAGAGGTSLDGIIDGSETIALNGPYLLWASGPDGFYGANVSEPDFADAAKIKKAVEKCDDIILAAQMTAQPRPAARAFTLVEMLTTVAVLVIVLGLMVSLARDVRTRSAERLTKDLLRRLDTLVAQYKAKNLKGLSEEARRAYPVCHPLLEGVVDVPEQGPDEVKLRENALSNNRDLVRTLRSQVDLSNNEFKDLSIANYNEVNVLDAWGSPIVFMPHQHPKVGMAAGDQSFFFSAGPDRKYLTRQDNLYSYEGPGGGL